MVLSCWQGIRQSHGSGFRIIMALGTGTADCSFCGNVCPPCLPPGTCRPDMVASSTLSTEPAAGSAQLVLKAVILAAFCGSLPHSEKMAHRACNSLQRGRTHEPRGPQWQARPQQTALLGPHCTCVSGTRWCSGSRRHWHRAREAGALTPRVQTLPVEGWPPAPVGI